MNTVVRVEVQIQDIRVTEDTITAYLTDGRTISVPLAWSWRLSEATPEQRANFEIIGDGEGVHWPDIDLSQNIARLKKEERKHNGVAIEAVFMKGGMKEGGGMKSVIAVENLVKTYGSLRAVDGVSFEVYENEIFGVVGPNGAGKTTMVECLEGLRVPSSGSIRVLDLNPKADGYKLRQLIGIQLQEGRFPDKIKSREALELFAGLYSRSLSAGPLLEKVGLLDKADSYFENLSGGQKQRLSIALALVNDPRVVFFDELTTGLDPQARRAMWGMVTSIRETGKTVILVTHFMEEAERLCDRVAILDRGRIVALDTPASLIRNIDGGLRISFSVDDPRVAAQLGNIDRCQLTVSNRDITIQCADGQVVGEVIRILGENNCDFHGFTVSKPTLEDVFLSLTGKEMRE